MPDAYEPQPIETSGVEIPPELGALGERLAEHVHDLWARNRRADGWTWGPQRDEALKETQNLVPYAQLPEEEKAYDRATAEGTLRAILALGFKITPPTPAGMITAAAKAARQSVRSIQLAWNPPTVDPDASELEIQEAKVAQILSQNLRRIVASPASPELDEAVSHLSKAALDFGETFLASEIARAGLEEIRRQREEGDREHAKPDPRLDALDAKLLHRQALCQANLGNADAAAQLIEEALKLEPRNSDVIAALGRIAKDRALAAPSPEQRREQLRRSAAEYGRARRATRDPGQIAYLGINLAAVLLWDGDETDARIEAEDALASLAAVPEDDWTPLTRAEALLILGKRDEALACYQKAREIMGPKGQWGALHTARRQARRHATALGVPMQEIEDAFDFPALVAFSGHLPDRPDRPKPRFPVARQGAAEEALRAVLRRLKPGFAVLSAAAGGDLMCLEALGELAHPKPERHVVLPWKKQDFIASSVTNYGAGGWEKRFDRALEEATTVSYLSQQTKPAGSGETHGIVFEHLNRCLAGMALLRARALELKVEPVVLWDGGEGLPGGTGSFAGLWRKLGCEVHCVPVGDTEPIVLAGASRPSAPLLNAVELAADLGSETKLDVEATAKPAPAEAPESGILPLHAQVFAGRSTVQTMLFADVVGFSKIPEHQIGRFAPRFLGAVSNLVDRTRHRPVFTNTWGDALYLVFDDPVHAGCFALELCERIHRTKWEDEGLPAGLDLRVALHTGPVFMGIDPILREITFTGSNVSHAARIEPVTAKGEVWASESFAAHVAVAEAARGAQPSGFALDYLGQVDFAKHYGRYPLFRVRRATAG